jgi:hypothetical protein
MGLYDGFDDGQAEAVAGVVGGVAAAMETAE